MWITWKVIVGETCFCEKIQADFTLSWVFQRCFNFVPMLESRNVDHVKSNCSWDMFLWKNSGGLHTFMSFSKIFQLFTHARITKCGSPEKKLFMRHVSVKNFRRTSHFHEFFKNISTLYPCYNHEMLITWKVIVPTSQFHQFFKIMSSLYPC